MTSKRERPIGITLLAIIFLWIGCIGFPAILIFDLSGDVISVWRNIAGNKIHSESVIRFSGYLFALIWHLFYVAYAVIGFGLWKLKNWAHKAILFLMVFCITACVVVAPFVVSSKLLSTAIITWMIIPSVWIIWYLMRPRVRFAFEAEAITHSNVSASDLPPKLSIKGKVGVAGAIAASFVLCSGLLLAAIENEFVSLGVYRMTLKEAQNSPCVADAIGNPLTPGWMISGSWEENNTEGDAALNIPIHGPKGKGSLELEAKKQSGAWKITSLILVKQSKRIQIVPSNATCGCH